MAFTTVVTRREPSHCTTEPGRKFVPFTVKVKAAPVATADAGLKLKMAGTGSGSTVKFAAMEVLPPESTVTTTVVALAIKGAVTEAVS